ncbi:MAG: hypothetical protein NVS4B3_20490 [Gemmatimonadaceae bacterium]
MALVFTAMLGPAMTRTPFALFYLAVVASAIYGGFGPGLLVTAVGVAAVDAFFFDANHSLHALRLASALDAAPFVAFAGVAYLISHITESLRERSIAASARAGEIERERAHVRALLSSAGDGIYAIDPGGRCTSFNPAAAAMLGYTEAEMVGQDPHAVVHYKTADGTPVSALQCPIMRANTRGETVRVPADVFWRKDGSALPVSYVAAPIIEGGVITGAVVTFADTTSRRRTERVQQFLADSGAVLAASLDFDTTLHSLAKLAVPMLGESCVIYTAEGQELRFAAVADVDPARGDRIREFRERNPLDPVGSHPALRVLRTGEMVHLADLREAGRTELAEDEAHSAILSIVRPVAAIWLPLAARGRVLGVVTLASSLRQYDETDLAVARELAQRAAVAIDNARLYGEAQAATHARDDVLAIVSHDLRNPIHTISMSASFMSEVAPGPGTATYTSQLGVIRRSADRANRLIGDLLDVTRIEAGRLAVERQRESAMQLVEEAAEGFQSDATARGIRLTVVADSDLPAVSADRERVLQLLANLLGNAMKFTPPGGRVTVSATPAEEGVRISVADTGPGIDPDDVPHLFDRYWQARRTDRRGVGLGLSIAKGIVEAHGGTIAVTTAPGEGSTFSFVLRPSVDGEPVIEKRPLKRADAQANERAGASPVPKGDAVSEHTSRGS